ncbi:EAL domain-containing protein [Thalassotalea euphylliae]|uniref:EAL domain-containing protein n=1 Tax=Thalassotalea euphylliae TaxID=1655234 RepID=A0A3E0TTN1_9GAMM|nr:EAL domain-containing response regulator [Thalassotalea euphylliae]REL28036.1 EAL domain-containing protein [Thalassotalea euphylliae]
MHNNNKATLYILDDNEQYAELLKEFAEQASWRAEFETNVVSFLTKEFPTCDALVLDLVMPNFDGIEVIRMLADRGQHCPLILVSGFDKKVLHSAEQLAKAHDIEVLATLTKPIEMSSFVQLLDRVAINIQQPKLPKTIKHQYSAGDIEAGIRNHELMLHYQPQICLTTNKVNSVEALVRWQHPTDGLVYPDQFIGVVEKHSLIDLLTQEILNISVRESSEMLRSNIDISLSINVSADNIIALSLPEQLKALTDKNHLAPSNLTLELTESAVMGELTSSLDVLNRLRMKGFQLSIDDFGTGYSSLQQLYQAPFNELKIDRQFVANMLFDEEAMIIVKICIMLGKMLNMSIVAEGVENLETLHQLQRLGCNYAQGYAIAKPMPATELIQWAKHWK